MAINYDGVQPSRLGALNAAGGDPDALFLKVFSGEVLTTFQENNVMMPLHRVRTISSGKTAQFPVTGVAAAKYHTRVSLCSLRSLLMLPIRMVLTSISLR